jgi:PAS domain S-box-containing protein
MAAGGLLAMALARPEGGGREPLLLLAACAGLAAGIFGLAHGLWGVFERQRSEADLREMADRFQRAALAGRVGLAEFDAGSERISCDAMTLELFGLPRLASPIDRDELLRNVHPADRQALLARIEESVATGAPFSASLRVRCDDGTERHLEASARPDAAGAVRRLVGAFIDTTRLRKAEQELSGSHNFLQTLIDTLPHTFFCKDAQGRFLLVNRAFAELRGMRQEDCLGKSIADLDPSEAALHQRWDESARQAGLGVLLTYECERALADGSTRDRLVCKALVDLPDGTTGIAGFNVDNTQRKHAEQRLAQNEERFRHLFEEAPLAYLALDQDANVLLANAAWLNALGYGADEARGRNFLEFLARESIDVFREEFDRFKNQGRVSGVEYLLRRKDGRRILASMDGRVCRDSENGGLRVHCTFQDITERRAAELEVAQNHRFLQTLVDSLPVPFACKDGQGRFLMVNRAFLSNNGLVRESVLGRAIAEVLPSPAALPHVRNDEQLLGNPEIANLQYEVEQATPGQDARHWLVCKSRLPLPGGERGIAALAIDITERKHAEEELRRQRRRLAEVIFGTNTGTWEWDVCSDALNCNERWAEMLGYRLDDFAPLSRRESDRLIHPEDHPRVLAAMQAHFAGEAECFDCEYRKRHKDGRWVWMHARGRVLKRGKDGEPLLVSGANSDITARKQAEDQLELVARIPVESPHPVLRVDDAGTLLYANPAAEPLLGGWGQKVGGRLPREIRREVALALESGQARSSERSYAGGVYAITVSPFVDRGYANIYAVDETQRKAAETAQRLSELRYRELAVMLRLMCDNVPDMIWAKDVDNRFLFANKAMCETLLGVEDTSLPLGKSEEDFGRWEQRLHPDDPNWHTLWERCMISDAATLRGKGNGRYEETGYVRGARKYYEICKTPFVNDQGAVIGTVGSARDITGRKASEEALAKSEERFRTMAQISPVGIFQADATARCTYVNEQWSRITGYPKEAPLGRGWLRTLPAQSRLAAVRALRKTARTGEDYVAEFHFRQQSGHDSWVLLRAAAERGPGGQPAGIVGALTDITEIKRAEAALRQAKAEAEAATKAKALFLANMSHEIRTPLSGVIGSTRLLAQSELDENQRRLAEMAVDSGRALLDVVNDILDFSKIEAGQLALRPQPFALRRMIDSLAGPFALLARERGLSLSHGVDAAVPDRLVGDEGRLGQVLRNLLSNAIKFTEHGGVSLAVQPGPPAAEGFCLLCTVKDTGIGIDPDYMPRLFDSFSQGDVSYAKQHGGTGLGLAICKSLVGRMGGSMQVQSTPGQGSTFSFTAVFGAPPHHPAEPAPAPAQTEPAAAPSEGLRLLLADDNAIGRMLMEHVLRAAGHQVATAADGRQVLRLLAEKPFDLVLMDVQMPVLDGISATRLIREGRAGAENAAIPIVALTAYASSGDRQNFLDAGMDEVVGKPAEEGPLFAAIQRAMASGQRRHDRPEEHPEAAHLPPRIDAAFVSRNFDAHPGLLRSLLDQLRDCSLPELSRGLAQALEQEDHPRRLLVAHRCRGAMGAVGAARAAHIAARLENAARDRDQARFAAQGAALLQEMAELAEHLRRNEPWR